MSLSAISINKTVVNQLKSIIASDCVSHAYLFIGEASSRLQLGLEFAKAILCEQSSDDACDRCVICRKVQHGNHEDILLVQKEENSVKVNAVESIISSLSYKAVGARIVVIVDDAHTMTVQAQNKLLKTLEEPVGNAVIILLSERKEAMIQTVVSRCATYYLQESEFKDAPELSDIAQDYLKLCSIGAPYYKMKDILENAISDRDKCIDFLNILEEKLRSIFLFKSCGREFLNSESDLEFNQRFLSLGLSWTEEAILITEDCRKAVKQSYNTSYMLKQMCLRMKRRSIMEE